MDREIIERDLTCLNITKEAIEHFDKLAKDAGQHKLEAEALGREDEKHMYEIQEREALEAKRYYIEMRESIDEKLIKSDYYQNYIKDIDNSKIDANVQKR